MRAERDETMKEEYRDPELEIIYLNNVDIITESDDTIGHQTPANPDLP